MKQLSYEEWLVYEICQDAGSMGALGTLFKNALKPMTQAKINQLLKRMEERKLIKSLKSVSKGNKKVYMVSEIEPSVEVTGGLTGTSNFDLDTIEEVLAKVENFVRKRGAVTRTELLVQLKQSGLPRDMLREEDIEQIITSMVLDMRLELTTDPSS